MNKIDAVSINLIPPKWRSNRLRGWRYWLMSLVFICIAILGVLLGTHAYLEYLIKKTQLEIEVSVAKQEHASSKKIDKLDLQLSRMIDITLNQTMIINFLTHMVSHFSPDIVMCDIHFLSEKVTLKGKGQSVESILQFMHYLSQHTSVRVAHLNQLGTMRHAASSQSNLKPISFELLLQLKLSQS